MPRSMVFLTLDEEGGRQPQNTSHSLLVAEKRELLQDFICLHISAEGLKRYQPSGTFQGVSKRLREVMMTKTLMMFDYETESAHQFDLHLPVKVIITVLLLLFLLFARRHLDTWADFHYFWC